MLIDIPTLITKYNGTVTGVIHAGAHVGEEAPAYERLGTSNVLWIEGNSDLQSELEANVTPYGHRVAIALLSDEDGKELTFNISNNFQSSSILEFETHAIVADYVHWVDHITLPSTTLDTLVTDVGFTNFNFLNMDLQGAEGIVLAGAAKVVDQLDYIYTEINVDHLYKDCVLLHELEEMLPDFTLTDSLLAGSPTRDGDNWVGWGDGLFVRSTLL